MWESISPFKEKELTGDGSLADDLEAKIKDQNTNKPTFETIAHRERNQNNTIYSKRNTYFIMSNIVSNWWTNGFKSDEKFDWMVEMNQKSKETVKRFGSHDKKLELGLFLRSYDRPQSRKIARLNTKTLSLKLLIALKQIQNI